MEQRNDQGNEDCLGSTETVMNKFRKGIHNAESSLLPNELNRIVVHTMDSLDEAVRLQKLIEMAYEVLSKPIGFCKDADDRVGLLLSLYLEHSQPYLATAQESLNHLNEHLNR